MHTSRKSLITASTFLLLSTGCGVTEGDSDTDSDGSSGVNNTSSYSESLQAGSDIGALNLSNALNIDVPDALQNDSSSLRLTGKKSREACEVGNTVSEGVRSIKSIANMFCHIEVEAENIEYGKKYAIDISGDEDQQLAIWVDDSDAANGNLKVNFCQAGKLTEIINVTGVGEDSSSGSVLRHGSEDGHNWSEEVKFDNGQTTAGKSFISVKSVYSNDAGSESFKRQLVMSLEGEVGTVLVSNAGTWQGETFAQAGGARLNADYGQVLFKHSGTHDGTDFDHSRRAFFDDEGYVVGSDASADFNTDGSLYVPDSEVPAYLPSDFSVAAFPSDAWDCSTDESFSIVMTGDKGAAHDACDGSRSDGEGVNCWDDSAYKESDVNHTIDESKQKGYDEVDDIEDL